jgi:hypothetical protein
MTEGESEKFTRGSAYGFCIDIAHRNNKGSAAMMDISKRIELGGDY